MSELPRFRKVKERHYKVLIVGGGESLIGFDMNKLKEFDGAIITVNNVVYHLPCCDYWITVDPMSNGEPQRAMRDKVWGVKYFCAFPDLKKHPQDIEAYETVSGVHYLERTQPNTVGYRLEEDKNKIKTGDSIYGALGLAYHMEAKQIIMLGVDGSGYGHWYDRGEQYNPHNVPDLENVPSIYRSSLEQFEKRGTKVVNGSENSIIDCFERMNPEEAFSFFD